MSFAVFELVKTKRTADEEKEDALLGSLNKYVYEIRTPERDTHQEAQTDFLAFKMDNPTVIKVEVRNVEDTAKSPFIYLP